MPFQKLYERALSEEQHILSDPGIGFTDLPETMAYVDMCDQALNDLPAGIDTLFVLGIGGSALGTAMVLDAFPEGIKRTVHVIDNIDSVDVNRHLNNLDPDRTALAVVSKSGSTLEPLALFALFYGDRKSVV